MDYQKTKFIAKCKGSHAVLGASTPNTVSKGKTASGLPASGVWTEGAQLAKCLVWANKSTESRASGCSQTNNELENGVK